MKKAYLSVFLCLVLFSACVTGTHIKRLNVEAYTQLDYKEMIKLIKTPTEAAYYLKNYLYYKKETACRSFKYIHERKYGKCNEYAVVAAALLSDNDYPPLILHVYYIFGGTTHAFFIYQDRKTKKWGMLSGAGGESLLPMFESPTDICLYFNTIQFYSQKIIAYKIHDLTGYNFIDGDEKDIYDRWHRGVKIILKQI